MALIDRTAYPRFKQFPDAKELAELYTPTPEEIKLVKSKTKSHEGFLSFMVMLKSFQRLGYFPHYEAQVKTRDYLVEIFIKRILDIQNNAKQRLQELRDKHVTETSELLATFGQVLKVSKKAKEAQDNSVLGEQVQSILDEHGGPELLLQKLDEIAAYNTNNHLPLMWRFYSASRKALFSLVRSLDILSTSADESVIEALKFVLDNEHKRGKYLPT